MNGYSEVAIRALVAERDELKAHCLRLQALVEGAAFPAGHFYSPLVDAKEVHAVRAVRERLAAPFPAGIRVDREAMREMLTRLAAQHRQSESDELARQVRRQDEAHRADRLSPRIRLRTRYA